MSVQYYIVAIVVAFIVVLQVIAFFKNLSIIGKLRALFPNTNTLSLHKESNTIECSLNHAEFEGTLHDINGYLNENQNTSADYQIIKEIVERDSQRIEEDVDTMLSTPLYLGLMATILGAAIGVVSFAWTDLGTLLTGTNIQVEGIKTLLTDIGIAMIASFLGVMFTAISTSKYKEARGEMLKMKNKFLSWIQTKVMPNMSDNLTGALTKMANDLNNFNSTFAENTKELKETLSQVTDNYDNQVKLLDAIDKIKIAKIAKANVEVYDKLQGCTEELERLFEHLGNSEEYIAQVVKLNSRLGDIEDRTRLSEELGNYFKSEIEYVQDRQGMMRQQMSSLKALEDQRVAINNKIAEINDPFGGLKDTFKEVEEQSRQGIESISSTFETQNTAIKEMLAAQKELLENEISTQRESLKLQFANVPSQMNELAKVMEKLNQTILTQQQKIDEQGNAIQTLASSIGTPLDSKGNTKRNWMNVAIAVGVCGSFIMLLAMLCVQVFDIKI